MPTTPMVFSMLGCAVTGLAIAFSTGCPERTISELTLEQGRVEYKDIPVSVNRNIDILFVIDDSNSMADKQGNLANNFPQFINVLATLEGGLPDVHIGVVTSDVGTSATQDAVPAPAIGTIGTGGCAGVGRAGNLQRGLAGPGDLSGVFLSDIKQPDGTRVRNYTGNLDVVFSKMAKVGAGGCGFEQHLEAMKRALDHNATNAGFLRPDAYLAVIFIADEDDCSISHASMLGPDSATLGPLQSFRCTRFGVTCDLGGLTTDAMNQAGTKGQCHPDDHSAYVEKVSSYVEFLKHLKPDPDKIIVAGIMGTTDPFQVELQAPPGGGAAIPTLAQSCSYVGGAGAPEVAAPPTRIKFLLDQFPNRSTATTICQQNLTDGLAGIAKLIVDTLPNPCIAGKLAMPVDCSVSEVTNIDQPNSVEHILPACDAARSTLPCWRIATDVANCLGSEHLSLKIERGEAPPPEDHVIAYCVTEPP